ncbi:MAG: phosphoribosylformylglycinamidine synthase subunit PurS [Candidatus Binatia bacterium]
MIAKVYVTPKPAILDPQGKAVASSLASLGYDEVSDVRLGKLIHIRMNGSDSESARARVEEMCRRLLANEVIEDFSFELVEDMGE